MKKAINKKRQIKGKESWRDLKITKKCSLCRKKYHPRRNGYQATSRFCSATCSKKGLKGTIRVGNKPLVTRPEYDINDLTEWKDNLDSQLDSTEYKKLLENY